MPGKSKEDAFRLGHEIADAITARNPKPMKMKFEKVRLRARFRRPLEARR